MVGVAGRSKGCHTCRKRKIACSLERPHCVQCLKSNRVCTGYQRDRVFIINSFPAEANKGTLTKSSPVSKSRTPVKLLKGTEETKMCSQIAYVKPYEPWPAHKEVHWSVLHEVSPVAQWRQQLLSTFLSGSVSEQVLGGAEGKPWLVLLSQMPSPSMALEKSTMAMCTARLGRMHGNEALLRKSLKFYTDGLQELQKALYDPRLMYKDETLGVCMSLASYELMECPGGTKNAYKSHHRGCARLIELRGAKAHTSGLGFQLFISFRTQAIMNSLEDHGSTYLSENAWIALPWKNTPKTPYDQLLDIVSVAPEIYSRTDDFDSLEPRDRLLAAVGVIEDCRKVDDRLHCFFQRLEESTPGPLYWPALSKDITLSRSTESSLEKLFPLSLHFPSLPIARTMILYWSVLTMLWTGMVRLYYAVAELEVPGVGPGVADLLPLGHRADFMAPTRNVLQSVEYLMQDKMLGLGPQSVIAPLSIVVDTIRDFPMYAKELAWGQAILDEIRGRGMLFLGWSGRKGRS